jgi:hypothetical protein
MEKIEEYSQFETKPNFSKKKISLEYSSPTCSWISEKQKCSFKLFLGTNEQSLKTNIIYSICSTDPKDWNIPILNKYQSQQISMKINQRAGICKSRQIPGYDNLIASKISNWGEIDIFNYTNFLERKVDPLIKPNIILKPNDKLELSHIPNKSFAFNFITSGYIIAGQNNTINFWNINEANKKILKPHAEFQGLPSNIEEVIWNRFNEKQFISCGEMGEINM